VIADAAGGNGSYGRLMPTHQPTALVLYASTHGHTARIAARIADVLGDHGVVVDRREAAAAQALSPGDYDGVVVVGSVHAAKHQKALVAFVKRHHTLLNNRPTAFVSVSLTAADDTEESDIATRRMIDAFLDETGLIPQVAEPVAGSLQYREYDFMTRLLMRVITRKHEDAHDMSHDHDYTNWDRVGAFAAEFAQHLGADAPVGAQPVAAQVP
jgi:menaquinone-dependent protoporphyrinogen oxidase